MRSLAAVVKLRVVLRVVLCAVVIAQALSVPGQRLACTDAPPPAAYTRPWPQRCSNSAAGFVCRAKCLLAPYKASTVCLATGRWDLSTSCPPGVPNAGNFCMGSPAILSGARWPCSNNPVGTVCQSLCMEGFSGTGYVSICQQNLNWSAPRPTPAKRGSNRTTSGCVIGIPSAPVCTGLPAEVPNASWNLSCFSGTIPGSQCKATCSAAAGFHGPGYTSVCTDSGTWADPTGSGCTGNGGNLHKRCIGQPPVMEGVVWELCNVTAPGTRCLGGCKEPYKGMGYYTYCDETAHWAPPKKQLPNDVGCKAVSCGGSMPAAVPDAVWDPACLTADASKSVCFAVCASGKTGYIAECSLATGTWGEPIPIAAC